jgi:hypothetical protein
MTALVSYLRPVPRLAALLAALLVTVLPGLPAVQEPFAACAGEVPTAPGEDADDTPDVDLVSPPSPDRSRQQARPEAAPGHPGGLPARPPAPSRTDPSRPAAADPVANGRGVRLRC